MDEWTAEDLSPEESAMIVDFVEWAGEFDRQVLEKQTVEGDQDAIGIEEAFEFLMPHISEGATEFDAKMLKLFRLEKEIKSGPVFEYEYESELPPDSTVTAEGLNAFLKREELREFFSIAGQMIESLSVELVMEKVVEPSKKSKSVRRRVERKSQKEREWLLHITGNISDGEKGEIRRTYDMRSSLVHDSENVFVDDIDIPTDVDRGVKAVNILHENLHGIELKHRFGDLVA
ncbi:hypothetical protein [Halorubrum distributum]|uniref:hypothetical protein n=1 Tax=Halorubrum distributum TaxID=29283 RepID=UPI0012670B6A|nr:hypothetical protein [Halorubrum distributum]MDV7348733.1 hypothetical protein [Halorubrum distributum]